MGWTIERAIPTLAVPDLEVGVAFYRRLGFEVEWRWPDVAPHHAGLSRGECALMLSLCDPEVRAEVTFLVDDVDACFAAVEAGRAWDLAAEAGALAEREDCPPARSLEPLLPRRRRRTGCASSSWSTRGATGCRSGRRWPRASRFTRRS